MDQIKTKAREVFELWFPIFSKNNENDDRERLFEYFHSGYMAGTKFNSLRNDKPKGEPTSIANDDVSRNLDL